MSTFTDPAATLPRDLTTAFLLAHAANLTTTSKVICAAMIAFESLTDRSAYARVGCSVAAAEYLEGQAPSEPLSGLPMDPEVLAETIREVVPFAVVVDGNHITVTGYLDHVLTLTIEDGRWIYQMGAASGDVRGDADIASILTDLACY